MGGRVYLRGLLYRYLRKLWFSHVKGHDEHAPDREIVSQAVHLALEAYRREEISQGKLRDLSKLLGLPAKDFLALAEAA